ncbi:fimbrial protein [Citrobacter werkmanii]|uniref:fimbrial protein n=1 Tax=Citrobacter werkmanii TaxID=67827 RepID=UPI00190152AB|nr:fimbrial protein [Citrobacter werkmanii]MBJ9295700.1 type 1 fimbrial protein [Citrobacter werkmanii]
MSKTLLLSPATTLLAITGLALASVATPVFANCTFSGGGGAGGVVTFQMPAVIVVEPDTPVGSIIYEDSMQSGDITQSCDSRDVQIRKGYTAISSGDARDGVLVGTYQTNVPGIGIRVAASSSQFPQYNEEDIIRPMFYLGSTHGFNTTYQYRAIAQLIVTGTIQEGDLNTDMLTSQEKYDDDVVGEIRFSPTSVRITTNTCNLVDKNIYVPLKTINAQDFNGQYSDILTDASFKIEVTDCAVGTQIDYQFKSSGSTGVTNGNILNIASGDNAASGVGIQILDRNDNVISFDQDYNAIASSRTNEPVEIPLKARYIKTGEVKSGKVDSVATFDVFYR